MNTVLHVLEAFAGGTERHLLDLVEHVPGVQHVIAVPSEHLGLPTAPAAARARQRGATVEFIEMSRPPSLHRNVAALAALRTVLHSLRPSIVHGHSSIGGALSRLAALGTDVPVVYTPNGVSHSPWWLAVERSLRFRTDRLIAVSGSERAFALRKRLISPDRVALIPNGIDPRLPAPLVPPLRERLGVPEGAPLVGCLGRLTRQKAPEVYVKACAAASLRVPDAHFVLVGNGPERGKVERALRGARLGDRFHWLDVLPEAASGFAELDLYVLPSRFEGGPYTPLEAMRAQIPVILSDVDGNRDVIEPGVSGLLVRGHDAATLGRAIADLLCDHERRAAFGTAGRERLERFDLRTMGAATSRVYDELLTGGSFGLP